MQQIQYIKTNQLHESSMNPRKEFDQTGITELAESIKQVGILQPIIARLNPHLKKKAAPLYEVICGSRRLSAAVIANLEEVPVIVRDLSDEEAFDLMITENLQRKDVSPLEEALAFQSLINRGNYDVNSLSDRFGKSPSYIRLRLKLNDIIPEFKELLGMEIINISHANEICKLEKKYQLEFFEGTFKERGQYWDCPSVKTLKKNIENKFTLKISEALFSIVDATLDKKAGACTVCSKNTASNMILFPEAPQSGLCLDRSCFKHKSDIHFDHELKRIQDEEPDVILGIPSSVYGEDEKQVTILKKQGVPVVEMSYSNGFQEVYEPKLPEEPIRDECETDDEYHEALDDFNSELNDYNEEIEEYQNNVASGKLRKVFMTVGHERGKILFYKVKESDLIGASGQEVGNHELIKELQEKDKRMLKLPLKKPTWKQRTCLMKISIRTLKRN